MTAFICPRRFLGLHLRFVTILEIFTLLFTIKLFLFTWKVLSVPATRLQVQVFASLQKEENPAICILCAKPSFCAFYHVFLVWTKKNIQGNNGNDIQVQKSWLGIGQEPLTHLEGIQFHNNEVMLESLYLSKGKKLRNWWLHKILIL